MKSLKKFIKFSNKMLNNGVSYNIEKRNCEINIKHGASSAIMKWNLHSCLLFKKD